jgi:predicted nucleic acid-binding protein
VIAIYAESSAVLAWLLGDDGADAARAALASAQAIVTSELTLVECSRVLIRAQRAEGMPEAIAADRRGRLLKAAAHWTVLGLGAPVLERASSPFPVEPLRSLDALHLASALVARSALDGLTVLSLDRRIRENALRLGLDVVPGSAE